MHTSGRGNHVRLFRRVVLLLLLRVVCGEDAGGTGAQDAGGVTFE